MREAAPDGLSISLPEPPQVKPSPDPCVRFVSVTIPTDPAVSWRQHAFRSRRRGMGCCRSTRRGRAFAGRWSLRPVRRGRADGAELAHHF